MEKLYFNWLKYKWRPESPFNQSKKKFHISFAIILIKLSSTESILTFKVHHIFELNCFLDKFVSWNRIMLNNHSLESLIQIVYFHNWFTSILSNISYKAILCNESRVALLNAVICASELCNMYHMLKSFVFEQKKAKLKQSLWFIRTK